MNETFKTELAAFARDVNAICDANPGTCERCPLADMNEGYCKAGFLNSKFDLEAVIAAVEAYRKHKKPCAEVIDKALDVYMLEVWAESDFWETLEKDVQACAEGAKDSIAGHLYANHCTDVVVRVLSAKRFVLASRREGEE